METIEVGKRYLFVYSGDVLPQLLRHTGSMCLVTQREAEQSPWVKVRFDDGYEDTVTEAELESEKLAVDSQESPGA